MPSPDRTRVTVRYWAGARAAAGRDEDVLELPGEATVGAALDRVRSERPALGPVLDVASVLVDGAAARPESPLSDGMRLEVLPPFAGG